MHWARAERVPLPRGHGAVVESVKDARHAVAERAALSGCVGWADRARHSCHHLGSTFLKLWVPAGGGTTPNEGRGLPSGGPRHTSRPRSHFTLRGV